MFLASLPTRGWRGSYRSGCLGKAGKKRGRNLDLLLLMGICSWTLGSRSVGLSGLQTGSAESADADKEGMKNRSRGVGKKNTNIHFRANAFSRETWGDEVTHRAGRDHDCGPPGGADGTEQLRWKRYQPAPPVESPELNATVRASPQSSPWTMRRTVETLQKRHQNARAATHQSSTGLAMNRFIWAEIEIYRQTKTEHTMQEQTPKSPGFQYRLKILHFKLFMKFKNL